MKTPKPILILLIAAVIASGLPLFMQADATRDSRIDLEDVILWVKGFVQTAEKPAAFRNHVRKLISSFEIAAGLKQIIRTDTPKLVHHSAHNSLFIISAFQFLWFDQADSHVSDPPVTYVSHIITPDTPPPRGYS